MTPEQKVERGAMAKCGHPNEQRFEIHSRQAVAVIGLIPIPAATWCKRCGALHLNGRWCEPYVETPENEKEVAHK